MAVDLDTLVGNGVGAAEEATVTQEGSVTFQSFALTLPGEVAKQLNPVFGKDARLVVASGPNAVYGGMGETAVASLTKAITASTAEESKPAMPFTLTISLARLIKAVSQGDADSPGLAVLAKANVEPGTDTLRIEERYVKNGGAFRIEAEEGVLKLIGAAVGEAGRRIQAENNDF